MNNQVSTLSIISENTNIFDADNKYIIPLYQRAFAWEEKEIMQLINDICDIEDSYFLGSLIVAKQDDVFEVVDGQQRLTALFILLKSLEVNVNNIPTFACREKSNYTLHNINNLIDDKRIEAGILEGKKIINRKINSPGFDKRAFKEKLNKVLLYRIEVPENTDLNRYFEIMNTRGEQLEQHDILKALLMGYLKKDSDKAVFAKVWDACSDMTGYVQMHFDVGMRNKIFGNDWSSLPILNFDNFINSNLLVNAENNEFKISNLIEPTFKIKQDDGVNEDNNRVRFESIIEFPYFLLHTLKVFIKQSDIKNEKEDEKIVDQLLDDKKLHETFIKVISSGKMGDKKISESLETFSKRYIYYLLKCRFLFDKYFIKREYTNDNLDGVWSLKELKISGQGTQKKPYYTNTYFGKHAEWETTYGPRTRTNIMLQSCLRVSYTSPKIMHWITNLLFWLTEENCSNLRKLNEYEENIEQIAKVAVNEGFLESCKQCNPLLYNLGVNTPHIVFNYLDYLLWKEAKEEYSDFVFEFRNSVEHWYPQNPSEGTFNHWSHDEGVDGFGNLCIIQGNLNSKFSNMDPEAKKSTFKDMIAKGSLKLRIMAEKTIKTQDRAASLNWKDNECKLHEKQMIAKLAEACQRNKVG